MDNTWVAQFYEETDPVKRMEMHAGKNCGLCAMENADQEKMNLSEALWN